MAASRMDSYNKRILRQKSAGTPTSIFRYWGAIGDFYYFLAFMAPLFRKLRDRRIILAADLYSRRYHSNPLLEICSAAGLIDELWDHDRGQGGPGLMPPECVQAAAGALPDTEVYTPGIYYDKCLDGPGVVPVPVEYLRDEAKMNPKFLVPSRTRVELKTCYPFLDGPYVTVQPFSVGKKKRNVLPLDVMQMLDNMGIPMVAMRFASDIRARMLFDKMELLRNVRIVNVTGALDSLFILSHAACHLGVESSQILGAAIQDVTCVFYQYGAGCPMFARDLSLESMWRPVNFDDHCFKVASMVNEEFIRGQ